MTNPISVSIDHDADAAYIRLSDNPIRWTEEATSEVLVDLDEFRVVVGVEVLGLHSKIPFGLLHTRFHVHSSVVEVLRAIQPSVDGFLSITQGSDSSTKNVAASKIAV